MKVLIVNAFGNSQIKTCQAIPRVGDRVGVFGGVKVDSVLFWPSKELLEGANAGNFEIEAIIAVS
jgi:hypothetical protein